MEAVLVGNAKAKNIKRVCVWCNKEFIMTCEDYIFNNCGTIIKHPNGDEWLCKECSDYIVKIKNL